MVQKEMCRDKATVEKSREVNIVSTRFEDGCKRKFE